jgi:beta-lactamase superfamily II metal-dependent hydrolase
VAKSLIVLFIGLLLIFLPRLLPTGPVSWIIPEGQLGIVIVDVGAEGDAQLVVSPSRKVMLVDTGDNNERVAWPNLQKVLVDNNVAELDILVITHPHQDHLGNAVSVLENFPPKLVVLSGVVHPNQTYEEMLRYIRDHNIPTVQAKTGVVLNFDPQVKAEVLGPNELSASNVNNTSIILKLTYQKFSIIFTGDAEVEEERQQLTAVREKLPATILRPGHHGSSSSSSLEYLQAVNPQLAAISAGAKNKYGHPHQEVLDRLANLGIETLITRERGTITILSMGEDFEVRTEK